MYTFFVIDTCAWPRWSAPILADKPSSSISVAIVLRNEWLLTPDAPSSSRTSRHIRLKLSGSRSVPVVDGKITDRCPIKGNSRRRISIPTAKRRGLDSIDLVVFDESYNLSEVEVSALTGAQLAAPNSQTIYTSTPPVCEVHPDCRVLADMRRLGRQRAPDLYFAEWSAPEGIARDDPETWRLASPSYGVIQKERDVRRMLAKSTTPSARALFDADVLGWGSWPPDESELAAVIPLDVWDAMAMGDEDPQLVGPVASRSTEVRTGRYGLWQQPSAPSTAAFI